MPVIAMTDAWDTPRAKFANLHRTLRDRICLLEYPPGTALSETDLARQFAVSRTPIRRVLQMLENEGLVETKPNVGSIVTTVDLKPLRDAFALRVKLAELLGDISPVTRFDKVLGVLDTLLASSKALVEHRDTASLCLISHRLQDALVGLSGNFEYRLMTESLYFKTIRAYYTILPELDWHSEAQAQVDEIQDIVVSLQANDVKAVGLVRRNHIVRTLSRITGFMAGDTLPRSEGSVC